MTIDYGFWGFVFGLSVLTIIIFKYVFKRLPFEGILYGDEQEQQP